MAAPLSLAANVSSDAPAASEALAPNSDLPAARPVRPRRRRARKVRGFPGAAASARRPPRGKRWRLRDAAETVTANASAVEPLAPLVRRPRRTRHQSLLDRVLRSAAARRDAAAAASLANESAIPSNGTAAVSAAPNASLPLSRQPPAAAGYDTVSLEHLAAAAQRAAAPLHSRYRVPRGASRLRLRGGTDGDAGDIGARLRDLAAPASARGGLLSDGPAARAARPPPPLLPPAAAPLDESFDMPARAAVPGLPRPLHAVPQQASAPVLPSLKSAAGPAHHAIVPGAFVAVPPQLAPAPVGNRKKMWRAGAAVCCVCLPFLCCVV